MKRIALCLLVAATAASSLIAGSRNVTVKRILSPEYLADGTGPTPPPIPMVSALSPLKLLADGTGPTPPPIPMRIQDFSLYLADGTGPTPPPIPMGSGAGNAGPIYVADGTGPTPPPIPMGPSPAEC